MHDCVQDSRITGLEAAKALRAQPAARLRPELAQAGRRRVLVLGLQRGDRPQLDGAAHADADMLVHADLRHLDAALIRHFRPQLVLSPLIARSWDILDLAERLTLSRYRGAVQVQTRPLPRAALVIAEIEGLYPGLSLQFVERAA